jgi:2-polyprenyl-6-methoxyphenol hydroxylase-like FAD-dependent oxidoreductase
MNCDVVVAGAGPTGLALACGLRAAGVDVRVHDKAAAPAVTSRALGLQPRGVELSIVWAHSAICPTAACRSAASPSTSTDANWRVSRWASRLASVVPAGC